MALFERPGQIEANVLTEKFLTIADKSIAETIRAFFECPYGFHGDTGLQHYLYHQIFTNSKSAIYWFPSDSSTIKTLLFQSEVYTEMTYKKKGKKSTSGRFDLAFVLPPANQDLMIPEPLKALIAFDVGRNKTIKGMGNLEAGKDVEDAKPGDAAKIVRDLRLGMLQFGYILEFFDWKGASNYNSALEIAKKLRSYCDQVVETRCRIALVVLGAGGKPKIWLYPNKWGDLLNLEYEQLDINEPLPRKSRGLSNYEDFLSKCGDGGRSLQEGIHAKFRTPLKLLYGANTMTVNLRPKGLLFRIGNKYYPGHGECLDITDSPDQLVELFRRNLKNTVTEGRVHIPDNIDVHFIGSILRVISEYLQQQNLDT